MSSTWPGHNKGSSIVYAVAQLKTINSTGSGRRNSPEGFIRTNLISAAMAWPTSPNELALTQTSLMNSWQGQYVLTAGPSPYSLLFLLFVALDLSFQLQRTSHSALHPSTKGPLPELFLLDTQNFYLFLKNMGEYLFSMKLYKIGIVL